MSRLTGLLALLTAVAVSGLLAIIPIDAQAASAGDLCLYGNDASLDTGLQMAPGTNPSIAQVSSGAEVAFQAADGDLATYLDSNAAETTTVYAMTSGSSPAITSSGSSVVIAMVGPNNQLWTGSGTTMNGTGEIVASNTNPSVAAFSATSDEFAFNSSTGSLVVGNGSSWSSQSFGFEPGTSPQITETNNQWEAADESDTSAAWAVGQITSTSSGDGESTSSGPAISQLGTAGDFEIAFEANTDQLYTIAGQNGIYGYNTNEMMAPATSPAVAAIGSGAAFEIAYQGANGDLWVYNGTSAMDTGHSMASGTSPAIAQTSAGFEVAYQCAPATAPVTTTVIESTTTPVTVTTPVPTTTTPSKKPRVIARLGFDMTWTGTSSHIIRVSSARRLPRSAVISVACLRTRTAPCPKLGKAPAKPKRTLARELAVLDGRTFRHNVVLRFTISATGYLTEVISARLPGDGPPKSTSRWK